MDLLREKRRAHGAHLALGGGGKVDNSGQNYAAIANAQLSREQLEWAKNIYAETADERDNANQMATDLSRSQLAASEQQMRISQESYDDYKNTYRPLEQQMVEEAKAYDTPEKRAAAAAAASSDVERNVAAQRGATMREMERAGVNPASGRTVAMQGSMDLGSAKLKAGAANQAMKQVETVGAAKRADAVNLGRGIASGQATNAALAMQQGNSAVANSGFALNAASAGASGMQAGYQGAVSANASAGSMFGNVAAQQASANAAKDANTTAGVGAAASIAAMIFMSDKNKKKDIKPTDPDAALEAVEDTPVSSWKYDAAKGGIDDGEATHIGPMAQDVRANMGEQVAPGGKVIDAISANGMAMAAIQGLSKKVDKLAAKVEARPARKPMAQEAALEY